LGNQNPITLGGEENIVISPLWWTFGPQYDRPVLYYFVGEFLNNNGKWVTDYGSDHSWDLYSNGFLATLVFDDSGADDDFNDLVMEIALMYLPITPPRIFSKEQEEINKTFFGKRLPEIKRYREEVIRKIEKEETVSFDRRNKKSRSGSNKRS
jgi:hypothetical protein